MYALCLVAAVLGSCKEKPEPPTVMNYENGVFVLNEGNFQGGNASLDFWHAGGDSVSRHIFRRGQDRPLGDVGQSMAVHENRLWVVVNNSGKIEVLNLPKLDHHCIVQGLTSPRYLLFLSAEKAYVSDLYSRSIQVLNPQTCSISGSIATGGWTEEMILAEGKVFVAQAGTDKVLVIDPQTDQLMDSLAVGREPNSLVQDASGTIWVLCSGGLGETNPSLVEIDPVNLTTSVAHTIPSVNSSPDRLRIDPSGERIYWVQDGNVMRLETGVSPAVPQTFAFGRGGQFYGLGIDPVDGAVLVSDAQDYVREGLVYRFDASGVLQGSFGVGVIPGSLRFE